MARQLSPFPLYAFYILEMGLKHLKPVRTLNDFKKALNLPLDEDVPSPMFITWNIRDPVHHRENQLRGCIGTFTPMKVQKGIAEYSLIAALEDTRFEPISLRELPMLSVSVTLLQNFEEAKDAFDWQVGKHGIRISFDKNGKHYGATFLPEVASEQGWSREETLVHLAAKAGYHFEKLSVDDIKLTRYQGIKSKVSYQDYAAFVKEHFE